MRYDRLMKGVTVGKYIDSLTDEGRDKIISNPFTPNDGNCWDTCLVGITHDNIWNVFGRDYRPDPYSDLDQRKFQELEEVAFRFPSLISRFGAYRVWRACKLRAARKNRVELPAVPQPEPAVSTQPVCTVVYPALEDFRV